VCSKTSLRDLGGSLGGRTMILGWQLTSRAVINRSQLESVRRPYMYEQGAPWYEVHVYCISNISQFWSMVLATRTVSLSEDTL